MIVLTTASIDTRPVAVDVTATAGIAALTLLPEGSGDALAAALTPTEARRLADELAGFAERHGA